MDIESNILNERELEEKKLLKYGFFSENGVYTYYTKIIDNQFLLKICIENHCLRYKVTEIETNEEYTPVYVKEASGGFVGKVKDEIEKVIKDIIFKCTLKKDFESNQAQSIIDYIKAKYNDDLEFLWECSPKDAIVRNKKNNKWYILFVNLEKRKVGIDEDGAVDIIDLRNVPKEVELLLKREGIVPAYHMNKKNWYTIILNGNIEIKEIFKLIDISYEISVNKK